MFVCVCVCVCLQNASQLTSSRSNQQLQYLEPVKLGGVVQGSETVRILRIEQFILVVPSQTRKVLSHYVFAAISSGLEG